MLITCVVAARKEGGITACTCADTAKTGEILGQAVDAPPWLCATAFCSALAAMCYWQKPDQLDKANGILLAAVLASFAVRTLAPRAPALLR